MSEIQREPITFNVNRQVEVRLTQFGRGVLRRYYAGIGMDAAWIEEQSVVRHRAGVPVRFAFWEFMQIFGPEHSIGKWWWPNLPIEKNEITLLPDTLAIQIAEVEQELARLRSVADGTAAPALTDPPASGGTE